MGAETNDRLPTDNRHHRELQLGTAETYECPVCRHGNIQAMPLMDAYACKLLPAYSRSQFRAANRPHC